MVVRIIPGPQLGTSDCKSKAGDVEQLKLEIKQELESSPHLPPCIQMSINFKRFTKKAASTCKTIFFFYWQNKHRFSKQWNTTSCKLYLYDYWVEPPGTCPDKTRMGSWQHWDLLQQDKLTVLPFGGCMCWVERDDWHTATVLLEHPGSHRLQLVHPSPGVWTRWPSFQAVSGESNPLKISQFSAVDFGFNRGFTSMFPALIML